MLSSIPSKLAMLIALFSFVEFNAQTWSIPITEVDQPVDFQMMDASFEKARIVGIGESTHGTHEFNVMYARTFKHLEASLSPSHKILMWDALTHTDNYEKQTDRSE